MNPDEVAAESLTLIAKLCTTQSCPAVYSRKNGRAVIQGYRVDPAHHDVDLPDDEGLVEVPMELILEAAARLAH